MDRKTPITAGAVALAVLLAVLAVLIGAAVRKFVEQKAGTAVFPASSVPMSETATNSPELFSVGATTTERSSGTDDFPVVENVPAPDDYSDVLVIANKNSSASLEVGGYFMKKRNIPPVNLLLVSATTSEEINNVEFQNLRSQVEKYITENNFKDTINYIVTTKGVPLKVKREGEGTSASVESELALIFSTDRDSSGIGGLGKVPSQFYLQSGRFSHRKYGMYLVTRLDAYTVDEVKAMIDKSGPGVETPHQALFVFDEDPNPIAPGLNEQERAAAASLESRGFNVMHDTTAVYLTGQQNVIGYVSWGSNDHHATSTSENGKPRNGWLPGSLAVTYVSSDGRTFTEPPTYGQSLIADIIREGATGAIGNVYEPYASAMPDVSILFDRYTRGYNLAESFYAALPYLSWMEVVIGDPKTTVEFVK